MVRDPSRIDGSAPFGQHRRSINATLPAGAGSQFASRAAPGEACWISRSTEPSGLRCRAGRALIEWRLTGFATNTWSASYMASDQKPPTGGSIPGGKRIT